MANLKYWSLIAFTLVVVSGCYFFDESNDDDDDESSNSNSDIEFQLQVREEPAVVRSSQKARLRFKDGKRFLRDLLNALELPEGTKCLELSSHDCIEDVHRINLGGVEPYHLGIRKPLSPLPRTAPISADRVALSLCSQRLQLDQSAPDQAVFLKDVDLNQAPSVDWLRETSFQFYSRILRRDPNAQELQGLTDFYQQVTAEQSAPNIATPQWATLGCYIVATTTEAWFY